jgi:hypothetical protein
VRFLVIRNIVVIILSTYTDDGKVLCYV